MADKDQRPDHPSVVSSGRLRRTLPVAGFAARTLGERVVAAVQSRAGNPEATARFHQRTAERYADLLGHSKGVLMKAGQLLSFVDLDGSVPLPAFALYQAALERLQADAPPMPFDDARRVVEAELGQPLAEVYARFEPEPLAAASIGQVHEAQLHDGRRVAVKVQYPGVDQAIRDDLANTELLSTFLQLGASALPQLTRIRHRDVARELTERIGEELDYHREAAHQRRFVELYRGHPFIHVPDVITEASARRVLTMEFAEGLPWAEARAVSDQPLKDQWGEVLYRFVFGTLRAEGLFNADPHPGNYLFGPDGTVSFVDFGCVKEFSRTQVDATKAIVRATLGGDGRRLRATFIEAGFLDASTAPEPDELVEWYRGTLRPLVAPQPWTFTPEYAADAISRMYDPTNEWHRRVTRHFAMPPDFTFTVRIELGLMSVLGGLGATGPWRAIIDELDGLGPPTTELGRQHADWLAARG